MVAMAGIPSEDQPLSVVIADTLRDQAVTVGELADRAAERGFGLLMVLLALPTMIPVLLPGTAAFIGFLYILLAVQMLIGLRVPWLPARVRKYHLSLGTVQALQQRAVPFMRRIERLSRPRWLTAEALVTRLVAVVVLLLGIVLFSPLPFLNTIPALTVLVLGIGLLNRDGIFLLLGLAMAAGVLTAAVYGAGTLIALYNLILDKIRMR